MHLLDFGERLTVSAVADDVVAREALSFIQLCRFQHLQAVIDDHIRRALAGEVDQGQGARVVVVVPKFSMPQPH